MKKTEAEMKRKKAIGMLREPELVEEVIGKIRFKRLVSHLHSTDIYSQALLTDLNRGLEAAHDKSLTSYWVTAEVIEHTDGSRLLKRIVLDPA